MTTYPSSTMHFYIHSCLDVEDPCESYGMDLNGISFTVSYKPRPDELFFSRLLRFTETTQECNFAAYLPVNANVSALGLSLHTECPLLALDELIMPEMSHTLNFIGSKSDCFDSDFLGIEHPALVIESELINSHLCLGNILELHSNDVGPDITTVFGRGDGIGYISRFPSVQVNIFEPVFVSEAIIRKNVFEVVATTSVFGYLADISITAPSNLSNWDELPFTVQGSFLSGNDSFVQQLSKIVVNKLTDLAESGYRIARYCSIDNKYYNEAELNVTRAEEFKNYTRDEVVKLQRELKEVKEEFSNNQDNLTKLTEQLESECSEQFCEDICIPDKFCKNCTAIISVKKGRCPIVTKESRNIHIPPFYVTQTTQKDVLECRLQNNQICQDDDCPIDQRENCHRKCELVTSDVPVYHWDMIEVNVYTYENCNVTIFNDSEPDTCCDIVNCALFAPDASCLTTNSVCRSTHQNIFHNIEYLRKEGGDIFERLLIVQNNLFLVKNAAIQANIDYEFYTQRSDQLAMNRDRLQDACDRAIEVYNKTFEETEPLLILYDDIMANGGSFQKIFRVNNVTFNERLTKSPSHLALTIMFSTNSENYEHTFVYNAQYGQANLDDIANNIIHIAFVSRARRSTWSEARFGSQMPSELTERQREDDQRLQNETKVSYIQSTG